jgi:hypothetical protein
MLIVKYTELTKCMGQQAGRIGPLEKGDHPDLDTSADIDLEGIKMYQSMISVFSGQ